MVSHLHLIAIAACLWCSQEPAERRWEKGWTDLSRWFQYMFQSCIYVSTDYTCIRQCDLLLHLPYSAGKIGKCTKESWHLHRLHHTDSHRFTQEVSQISNGCTNQRRTFPPFLGLMMTPRFRDLSDLGPPCRPGSVWSEDYPLVMTDVAMGNHHF